MHDSRIAFTSVIMIQMVKLNLVKCYYDTNGKT